MTAFYVALPVILALALYGTLRLRRAADRYWAAYQRRKELEQIGAQFATLGQEFARMGQALNDTRSTFARFAEAFADRTK